jgi:hypothetical protein
MQVHCACNSLLLNATKIRRVRQRAWQYLEAGLGGQI